MKKNKEVIIINTYAVDVPQDLRTFQILDKQSEKGYADCLIFDYVDPHTGEAKSYAFSSETEKHLRFLVSLLDGGRP